MARKAPKPAAKTKEPRSKRPALRISEIALAQSGARKRQAAAVPVFGIAQHPPALEKAVRGAKMAMDDAAGVGAWASSWLLQTGVQGLTFLGYPFLAELAQRPEYRVISEIQATEMTREWIEFTSQGDEDKSDRIADLEAEFKRLNARDIFCRALTQDGFFGRGHIYLDTGDTDDPAELKTPIGDGWSKVSASKISPKRPIKALRTVEAVWCYPTSYNSNNPLKDNWYRPDMWFVQQNQVHASRLLTLIGREVPDLLKPTYSFGGISLSQLAKPYVDNWIETRQGVNDIVNGFSIFALLTNLSESLQGDGDLLFKRADLFNNLRDNRGLMMLDKETEDFKNVAAPLSGLDALQAQAQEHLCTVARAPKVKLLGLDPAGLNASSEGEMRAFYDHIKASQEHQLRGAVHTLLGLVMLSLWGEVDKDISFEFKPLWALDEKGEAEVEKLKAETDQVLIDVGAISPAEARARVAADPGSDYATIEVEDVPDLLEEETTGGLEPEGGRPEVEEAEVEEGSGKGRPLAA